MIKNKIFLFALLLIFSKGFSQGEKTGSNIYTKPDTLRGTLSPLRSCYDVLHYDLDIKIDIENKFLSGSNSIRFSAQEDLERLQLDLFENMQIERIEFMGRSLRYTREFNAVFVDFNEKLKKGAVNELKIVYSGRPQVAKNPPWDGGFTWSKNDGSPFVGVSCQGTGASLWWPCKDHQSDEPLDMNIRITIPDGLEEVSNGRLIKKTRITDGWTKYEWYVSYPINNYDVTVNIAKYRHFNDVYYNKMYKDSLTLDYFVLPDNYEKAKKQFEQVKPMMDSYYHFFGEYPFVHDGFKLVESPYLGMEHQSCIAYGNRYLNGYLGFDMSGTGYKFDYIVIHESAHEWWGNSITTNDIADMWIHEGFATYSEALYTEYLYGHDAYLRYINSEKNNVKNDIPLTGTYGVNKEGSDDMYPKGALLLHTIRSIIDDDGKFFRVLKGIQEKFKYQTINSSDVEAFISSESGIDFSKIFDQYLHKVIVPQLQIKYSLVNKSDLKVSYRFNLPVENKFSSYYIVRYTNISYNRSSTLMNIFSY